MAKNEAEYKIMTYSTVHRSVKNGAAEGRGGERMAYSYPKLLP